MHGGSRVRCGRKETVQCGERPSIIGCNVPGEAYPGKEIQNRCWPGRPVTDTELSAWWLHTAHEMTSGHVHDEPTFPLSVCVWARTRTVALSTFHLPHTQRTDLIYTQRNVH